MPKPVKVEFKKTLLLLVESKAHEIQPITSLAIIMQTSPQTMYRYCYEDGHPVQTAVLIGETRRWHEETNRFERARQCYFNDLPFSFQVGNETKARKLLPSDLGILTKHHDEFINRFTRVTLSARLEKKLFNQLSDKTEDELFGFQNHILKNLDKRLGIKGRGDQDNTYNVEHLKLLEVEEVK